MSTAYLYTYPILETYKVFYQVSSHHITVYNRPIIPRQAGKPGEAGLEDRNCLLYVRLMRSLLCYRGSSRVQEMVEPGNPVFNQWKVQPVPTVDTKGPQPSLDTLDAIAWVDLRDQPMIIRVPLKYDERCVHPPSTTAAV